MRVGRIGLRAWFVAATGAAAVALFVLFSTPVASGAKGLAQRYQSRKFLRSLTTDLRGVRVLEPRIAVRFDYARFPAKRSTSERRELPASARLTIAELDGLAARSNDTEILTAAGSADLLEGRVSDALALFERGQAISSPHAALLTAMSAARWERAQPGDIVRSFDAARQAVRLTPQSPEALFNAALAGQRMLTAEAAADAWTAFVAAESDRSWRAEGEQRLKLMPHPRATLAELETVEAVPGHDAGTLSSFRAVLFEDVLPRWAAACLEGRHDEERALARASDLLATRITSDTTDRYAADLVAALLPPGTGRCERGGAERYRDFARARRLYSQERQTESLPLFQQTVDNLTGRAFPLQVEARVFVAPMKYLRGDHEGALRDCAEIATIGRARGYPALVGRAEYIRGWAAQDTSRFQDAFEAYESALKAYTAAGDGEGVAATRTIMASLLDSVGEYEQAWAHRETALNALRGLIPSKVTYSILSEATKAAARDGLHEASLSFSRLAIQEATHDKSSFRIAEASLDRTATLLKVGARPEAGAELDVARREVAQARTGADSSRLTAKLALAEAAFERDPDRAIARLNDAIRSYADTGSDITLARLLLSRGRALIAKQNDAAAEVDFTSGIEHFERARAALRDPVVRVSYFDEAWELFDESIGLLIRRGRFDEALRVAERERGRDLRDVLESPADMARGVAAVPEHSRLLYYAVLPRSIVIWVLGARTNQCVVVPQDRKRVEALVRGYTAALRRGAPDAELNGYARELYEMLIGPVRHALTNGERLLVVADPLLQAIPFGALRASQTARYVIEDHELAMMPSLAVAVAAGGASGEWKVDRDSPALVVAAGRGGDSFGSRLSPLPNAEVEATGVTLMYRRGRRENDPAAKTVLDALPSYSVFHFAGHSVVNPDAPQLSRLVVSGSAADSSLYAYQVEHLDLHRLALVVLSACDTAVGRSYRSEGVVSMARSFMKGGVPTVISTLWTIEDTVAIGLFTDFHRQLLRGEPAVRALALAQRAMLRSPNRALRSPSNWAAAIDITRVLN